MSTAFYHFWHSDRGGITGHVVILFDVGQSKKVTRLDLKTVIDGLSSTVLVRVCTMNVTSWMISWLSSKSICGHLEFREMQATHSLTHSLLRLTS